MSSAAESQAAEGAAGRASVLYVTDTVSRRGDTADLFDLAYLLRSDRHDLAGISFSSAEGTGLLVSLAEAAGRNNPLRVYLEDEGLRAALESAPVSVNLVVAGGYERVARLLRDHKSLFREKMVRLFVIGGYVNRYDAENATNRLPIDPRLRERNPERFTALSDPRLPIDSPEASAWATLLNSGEGVIWLPRDICLWRYAAMGLLEGGGEFADLLCRELAARNPDNPEAPVLLSSLPALLLCLQPDPFAWMRLFRVVPAQVEAQPDGSLSAFITRTESPNLYTVIAIDGQALGQRLTTQLRDKEGGSEK